MLIPIILVIPLLTTFGLIVVRKHAKSISLLSALITFVLSLGLWIGFDLSTPRYQFVWDGIWPSYSIATTTSGLNGMNTLAFGVDGISVFFVILTTFLICICILASSNTIQDTGYYIAFTSLNFILIAIFTAMDLFFFYVFFEAVLIPMFLIISGWGSRVRKVRAAYQFFLYTLIGSLFMLIAVMSIYFQTGTTDITTLIAMRAQEPSLFSFERERLLWLGFFASFAVKVPMIPFHIWLPEAHVEAPTAGSVLLAGILLKLGTYGFIRFSLPLFPAASTYFTPFIFTLSALAVIYTSLTTLRQIDLKKIIAYSSVAHMGLVTIGIFTNTILGLQGAILIMISHGFVSSALFLCIGVLYDRYHTRIIKYYQGLATTMPVFAIVFLFFSLANLAFPGTSSFAGEMLVLFGAFQVNTPITVFAAVGMVLGAAYSVWLANRVLFGPLTTYISTFTDMSRREFAVFLPLIILTIAAGVYPTPILDSILMSCLISVV